MLLLNIQLIAGTNKNADRLKYLESYKQITARFLYPDEIVVNMHLSRQINKTKTENNSVEVLVYQQTFDHYLKILQITMQNQLPVKEKHYYYAPDGELIMAENEVNHFERIIYLYDKDNPIIYSKSDWNSNQEQYDEVDFGTMKKSEDSEALKLLRNSVDLYNSTQGFLDKLAEQ
jgi:hypothetical protein